MDYPKEVFVSNVQKEVLVPHNCDLESVKGPVFENNTAMENFDYSEDVFVSKVVKKVFVSNNGLDFTWSYSDFSNEGYCETT